MRTQIGWYNLNESRTFTNSFETAAWYEEVRVPAGRYPVYVYDARFRDDGELTCRSPEMAYVPMDGVIESDYFGSLFFGVPISHYDTAQNVGKASTTSVDKRLYELAKDVLSGSTDWELLPEYEARRIDFEYDGEPHHTWGIFKAEG